MLIRSLRCLLSLAIAALLIAGCGSSESGSPASFTTRVSPVKRTTAATTTTPAVPQDVSYNVDGVEVVANNFTFDFSATLTMGAATTDTEGQEPPYENVVAPISGEATLTNTTSGYTVDPTGLPLLGVFAVYPDSSPVCDHLLNNGPQFHPGPSNLCGIDIAEFAISCDQTPEPLADGASVQLVPWAQFSLSELQPGAPQICANVSDFPIPSSVNLRRINSDVADAIVARLTEPPRYWALLLENGSLQTGVDPATGEGPACESDEYYIQGGELIGQVIDSQPSGLTGCLGE